MPTKGQLVAQGTYTTPGEHATHHETWQLSRMARGLLFSSRVEQDAPKAQWSFTLAVTQQWHVSEFSIRYEADNQVMVGEQAVQGSAYIARIGPRGQEPKEIRVPFAPGTLVDFASPLFTAVALVQLNLQAGQEHEADTIVVPLGSLEPHVAKRKYGYVAAETVEVPAGKISAWHYVVRPAEGEAAESHFWADRYGIVLRHRAPDGREIQLANYRRIDRR